MLWSHPPCQLQDFYYPPSELTLTTPSQPCPTPTLASRSWTTRWEPAGTSPSLSSPSPKHRVQRRVPGPHRCQQPIPGAAVGHILLTAETPKAWGTRAGERGHMVHAGAGAAGTAQTLIHVLSTAGAGETGGTGAGEGAQGGLAGAPVQARVCAAEEPSHSSACSLQVQWLSPLGELSRPAEGEPRYVEEPPQRPPRDAAEANDHRYGGHVAV